MISNVLDRISFWSLFLVIVLLPLFFLPFSKIPIETSKGLLLIIGLAVSIIFWTAARFSDGKITFPRSKLLLSGLFVVLAFLISAIFSNSSQMSLFGIMFDIGTFWFMLAAFLLMLVSSVVLKDPKNAKKVFIGLLYSFLILFIFQVLHIFMPNSTSFGLLGNKTSNLLGSWTSLGFFAGLLGIMSLFALEFFSLSKRLKRLLRVTILFSVILGALINSTLVWEILGVFALIIFIYKISFSFSSHQEGESRKFPVVSLAVVMVSLLFFMAGQFIGGALPARLGLSNIEVGPSFGATMQVTKATLAKSPILGIGPNRFGEAWATSKPAVINSTQFWDVTFDSGSGLLLTFAATTGILGIIAWLVFFFMFIMSGLRYIFSNIKNNINSEMAAFFVAALYLFVAAIFYSTGPVLFLLAFAFTGAFIGLSKAGHERGEASISFFGNPRKSFISILLLVVTMIASAALGFKYVERFASVSYFGRALAAQDIEGAESSINKAISLYQNDLYLRTYAQVYLVKLNTLASKGGTLTDAEKADLQASFEKAVNGAQLATTANANNYLNFRALGAVYETVGSYGVADAYGKAIENYEKASMLSPMNPGLKLSAARVSFVGGKLKEAKELATEAVRLKNNYIDALILLSQIAKSEGDTAGAISYAESALSFSPTNKDLIQYVNTLKGNSSSN